MNKLIIPALMGMAVLAAGILAFTSVEEAGTVHTSIQGTQLSKAGARAAAQFSNDLSTNSITITSTRDFVVYCSISEDNKDAGTFRVSDGVESEDYDLVGTISLSIVWAANAGETITVGNANKAYDGLCTAITQADGTVTFG